MSGTNVRKKDVSRETSFFLCKIRMDDTIPIGTMFCSYYTQNYKMTKVQKRRSNVLFVKNKDKVVFYKNSKCFT